MNETMTTIMNRKSVRAYTDREISPECREQILRAAAAAPTAGNQQLYTILDIISQELKEKLADTCDHQPFIARGKMVLVFCADFQKWYQAFALAGCCPRKPGPGDFLLAVEDAAIAAQNDYVFPALMLVFGYPTEQQRERPKRRRAPLDFIVHENEYPQFTSEDIRRNIGDLNGMEFDQWMEKFCKRKYHADFSLEMSRSVGVFLKRLEDYTAQAQ